MSQPADDTIPDHPVPEPVLTLRENIDFHGPDALARRVMMQANIRSLQEKAVLPPGLHKFAPYL